jgi:AraC family transcriptional regulator of arabinose operon
MIPVYSEADQVEAAVFRLGNLTGGVIVQNPGDAAVRAAVGKPRLIVVRTGEIILRSRTDERVAGPETIIYVPQDAGGWLHFSPTAETRYTWLHFRFDDIDAAHQTLLERLESLPWPLPLSAATAGLAASAVDLQQSRLPTAFALRKSLGMEILLRILGESTVRHSGLALSSPVEAARRFISDRLSAAVTLREVAAAAAVSRSQLARLFAAELGTTPIAYLWQLRTERGIHLLEESSLAVNAIARQCGFRNQFHFARRVRQATGLTPSAVRRRAQRI